MDHECRLIVDESFVEFSRAGRTASVEGDVDNHPNLVVIKSMSKVFGIAGLRIGYLLTADRGLAGDVRAHLPIWNLNGIAESFLRRVGRYRREFEASCEMVRATTEELYHSLRRCRASLPSGRTPTSCSARSPRPGSRDRRWPEGCTSNTDPDQGMRLEDDASG